MTIKDFAEKYNLHDSGIEKIIYDAENKKIILTIEFCFWMQNWYIETEPSNGKISATFENVTLFEYDENISDKIFSDELDNEILNAKLENEILFLNVRETVNYQPIQEIFYNLRIKAENVEVTELERYDL